MPASVLTALAGRRVLITGGAGFVGSHVADILAGAGVESIVILDNMVRGRLENLASVLPAGNVRVVTGDIRDTPLLASLVRDSDLVFHLAALRITQCAAEPRAAIETMIDATFELVEACRQAAVKKIVYASSASVYGMASSFPTREDHHPYANRTLYGAAKVFGEGLLRAYNDMYGLDYIGLRFFNVYGPRMDVHGKYTEVLVRWMERLEAGEPPLIFGDGQQTMDMLHVRDVARACVLSAAAPASDVVLNVGGGTETSLLELAIKLSEVMGRPDMKPEFRPERAVNPVPKRLADVATARDLIGFETVIPLEAGLSELVDWWREERGNLVLPVQATA
ncbi:MAG: NAD-dependent epimerase/dehydratase family protein [Hyphomicrobium sp.]|uniref:NAD-dependent epimerase/dehydratase family protein n=1 Tax=Hyphomicrobium sp. TaxID=82 RepID=UPI003D10244E